MIVAMQESATEEQIQGVVEHLIRMGFFRAPHHR